MLLTFDVTISESIDFTDDKRHTLDYTGKYIYYGSIRNGNQELYNIKKDRRF